jgi:hypothetical protein
MKAKAISEKFDINAIFVGLVMQDGGIHSVA